MGKRISALRPEPRGSCGEFVRNVLYGTRKAAYGKIQIKEDLTQSHCLGDQLFGSCCALQNGQGQTGHNYEQ